MYTPEELAALAFPYEEDGHSKEIINLYRKIWLKGYTFKIFNTQDAIYNLRASYFALRDKLHTEGSTGYSKIELHELAKKYIFPKLVENPDNFIDGGKDQKQLSVTWLSEQGWKSYIEEFKLFCAENFNFYL